MNQFKKSIVYHNDGSVSAPTATFGLDTDTGMYRIGDGIIGFASNGSEALRIDSSGAVNTGGTVSTNKANIGSIMASRIAVTGDAVIGGQLAVGVVRATNLAVHPEPPASVTSPGTVGQFVPAHDKIYVCVGPNLWRQASLTAF